MKAMILAAGFGTRLKPLTDTTPKALVPVKGIPMINYQIEHLKKAGITDIVINSHHHPGKLENYFKENNFGVNTTVVHEDIILGTGGGILNAEKYLKDEEFFLVMNVDIDTDFDLTEMVNTHAANMPFATLGIQKRRSTRYLAFSNDLEFTGRADEKTSEDNKYAFNGIHVISNKIFSKGIKKEYADIVDIYMGLKEDEKISGYDMGKSYFKDLGKIEDHNP